MALFKKLNSFQDVEDTSFFDEELPDVNANAELNQ